jgi:ABC-type sugar transport system ATPase subunit
MSVGDNLVAPNLSEFATRPGRLKRKMAAYAGRVGGVCHRYLDLQEGFQSLRRNQKVLVVTWMGIGPGSSFDEPTRGVDVGPAPRSIRRSSRSPEAPESS